MIAVDPSLHASGTLLLPHILPSEKYAPFLTPQFSSELHTPKYVPPFHIIHPIQCNNVVAVLCFPVTGNISSSPYLTALCLFQTGAFKQNAAVLRLIPLPNNKILFSAIPSSHTTYHFNSQ